MDASVLDLDLPATVDRICARIKESAAKMGKRGLWSRSRAASTARVRALAVRALGRSACSA